MSNSTPLHHLLFIYLFLLIGYSFTKGFFSLPAISLVIFSFIYFSYFIFKNKQILSEIIECNYEQFLKFILLISVFLALYLDKPIYSNNYFYIIIIELFYLISIILILFLFFRSVNKNHIFIALLFIAFSLRIITLVSSPKPYIDVFEILTKGSRELLGGNNPYQLNFQELYPGVPANIFGYLPGIFIFTVPVVTIFQDVRVLMILAQLITVILLYKLINNRGLKQLLILIFLFNPLSSFIIEQSWIEPLINMLIILFIYLILTKKRFLAAVIFGVFLASKQFHFLSIIPLTKLIGTFNKKMIAISFSIFFLIITPFLIISAKDFVNDTINYQLYQQGTSNTFTKNLIHSSLSFNSLYFMFTGKDISFYLIILILLAIYIMIYFSGKRSVYWFVVSMSFWLFSFFLFNHMAFLNYYYQVSFLIILAQAVYLKMNKA